MRATSLTLIVAMAALVGCKGDPGPQGPEGPQGPQGEPGTPGVVTPSISAVIPNMVYTGRTKTVTISGNGTAWASGGVTVDFGAGVTVTDTIVASPSAIVATVDIAPDATLGARDVTVTMGSDSATYAGAFMLEEPLAVTVVGTPTQGSIVFADMDMLDITTPFDPATFAATAGDETFIDPSDVQPFSATGVLFLNIDAATGPADVMAVSGVTGSETVSMDNAAFSIGAAVETELTPGDNEGVFGAGFETQLWSFTTPIAPTEISIDIASFGDPYYDYALYFLLPASGRFEEAIALTDSIFFVSEGEDTYYVVALPYYTAGIGYDYAITMTQTAAPPQESEPNDDCSQAMEVNDGDLIGGNADPDTDEDWYVFKAKPADVGKTFTINVDQTVGADTVTGLYFDDCSSDPIEEVDGFGTYYPEEITYTIDAAGDYYVKIVPYVGFFGAATGYYHAEFTIQ